MALVIGQRRDEVAGMKWAEIKPRPLLLTDVNVTPVEWVLEGGRTKSGRAHVVPLSSLAMTALAELPRIGAYVFTSGGHKPIRGYSKAKADRDKAVAATRKKAKAKDLPGWTIHDLRRTAATTMAQLGVALLTVDKVLNHADQGVTAIYDRHEYLLEKRRALEAWGQHLTSLMRPASDNNVVSLSARVS
jgi:integrase